MACDDRIKQTMAAELKEKYGYRAPNANVTASKTKIDRTTEYFRILKVIE